MKTMNQSTIATERLTIRPIILEDVNDIHEYVSDQSITMMLYFPHETIEETKNFVTYSVASWNRKYPKDREYVILFDGKNIGCINLVYGEGRKSCEMGWIIHREYRNKGFATEAANALLDFAFKTLHVNSVKANCDAENTVSQRVMQKIGMKLISDDGLRLYPKTGLIATECTYAITKADYEANQGN